MHGIINMLSSACDKGHSDGQPADQADLAKSGQGSSGHWPAATTMHYNVLINILLCECLGCSASQGLNWTNCLSQGLESLETRKISWKTCLEFHHFDCLSSRLLSTIAASVCVFFVGFYVDNKFSSVFIVLLPLKGVEFWRSSESRSHVSQLAAGAESRSSRSTRLIIINWVSLFGTLGYALPTPDCVQPMCFCINWASTTPNSSFPFHIHFIVPRTLFDVKGQPIPQRDTRPADAALHLVLAVDFYLLAVVYAVAETVAVTGPTYIL